MNLTDQLMSRNKDCTLFVLDPRIPISILRAAKAGRKRKQGACHSRSVLFRRSYPQKDFPRFEHSGRTVNPK